MKKNSVYIQGTTWHSARQAWREFWTILYTLNRRAELERLVSWATRRRLPGPRRMYESRLQDEERRLLHYTLRSPRQTAWAWRLHRLNGLITPVPRHPTRGSAAAYSSKRWARSRKIL